MPSKEDCTDRREAYLAWLTANGINPRDIPAWGDVTIEDTPEGRVLHYEVFHLTPDGHRQMDERREEVAVRTITVPLLVEPPEWWQPYQKPTRHQLLAAIRDALPAVRKAIDALPEVCRYHGEHLDPPIPSYGSESCCDTGRPAMRRRAAEYYLRALTAHLEKAHS
jgi:hypothetical protein